MIKIILFFWLRSFWKKRKSNVERSMLDHLHYFLVVSVYIDLSSLISVCAVVCFRESTSPFHPGLTTRRRRRSNCVCEREKSRWSEWEGRWRVKLRCRLGSDSTQPMMSSWTITWFGNVRLSRSPSRSLPRLTFTNSILGSSQVTTQFHPTSIYSSSKFSTLM